MLEELELAGLPALARFDPDPDDPDAVELVTTVPPGVPLGDRLPLSAEEAAGVVLALGTLLREVALAGVERDPITIDQVHLASGGRPVLRHLAGARRGAAGGAHEPNGADLGRILLRLLPPPGRRPRWRLGSDTASPLRALAHRSADPALTLDVLLDRIRAAAPSARLPIVDADPGIAPPPTPRPPSPRVAAVGAAVIVAAAAVGGWMLTRPTPRSVELAAPTPTSPATVEAEPGDEGAPIAVWPPRCPSSDDCGDALRVDGTTVRLGTHTWELKGEGDYALAVFDVDCDGTEDVVALDRSVGEVWLLPRPGANGNGHLLGSAPGAAALVAPDGCGPPRTRHDDGTITPMPAVGQDDEATP